MRTAPKTSIEVTNFLKSKGFNVSTSYGRNAHSTYVRRTKGFNVGKAERLSKLGEKVVTQFIVSSDDNELLESIKKVLKDANYVTGAVKFGKLYVAGEEVNFKFK